MPDTMVLRSRQSDQRASFSGQPWSLNRRDSSCSSDVSREHKLSILPYPRTLIVDIRQYSLKKDICCIVVWVGGVEAEVQRYKLRSAVHLVVQLDVWPVVP